MSQFYALEQTKNCSLSAITQIPQQALTYIFVMKYDIAVLGGGLAGLSVLYHLARAGKLVGKSILLVDPEGRKSGHDRSWSFWEKEAGPFEELVHHRWPLVTVHDENRNIDCSIAPYVYKLIRSDDFYAHVNGVIDTIPGLKRLRGTAEDVRSVNGEVRFKARNQDWTSTIAFSSLPLHLRPRQIKAPYLDQHFRGWFIETEEDAFDPGRAALMDFRTPQQGEARFFYVMPFTKRTALVEVAIFSNNHLAGPEYDGLLEKYIQTYWTKKPYVVTHTESGNIPMTTYPFPVRDGNLVYVGMRGGATRPSTGYTFWALQNQLMRVAENYPDLDVPAPWSAKHIMYDATLLRILQNGELAADELFVDMFDKNPPDRVLAFLNGETSLLDELRFMSTTNVALFGRRFIGELLNA